MAIVLGVIALLMILLILGDVAAAAGAVGITVLALALINAAGMLIALMLGALAWVGRRAPA